MIIKGENMVIKQHSKNVKTFAETKGIFTGYETFLQFVFSRDNNQMIEFAFHGEEERQEFLMQMQNIIDKFKIDDYWTEKNKPKIDATH